MGTVGKVMTHRLLNFFKSSKENELPYFYKKLGEEVLPFGTTFGTNCSSKPSSITDKNKHSSATQKLYFIKEDKFNEIKDRVKLFMDELNNLCVSYNKNYAKLTAKLTDKIEKTALEIQLINKSIEITQSKIELIDDSIKQLKKRQELLLDKKHTAACIPFTNPAELIANKSVNGLHALLKNIKETLTEINSSLNRIKGTHTPTTNIQMSLNTLQFHSTSIISLVNTLLDAFDSKQQGVRAQKIATQEMRINKSTDISSTSNQDEIYPEKCFKH